MSQERQQLSLATLDELKNWYVANYPRLVDFQGHETQMWNLDTRWDWAFDDPAAGEAWTLEDRTFDATLGLAKHDLYMMRVGGNGSPVVYKQDVPYRMDNIRKYCGALLSDLESPTDTALEQLYQALCKTSNDLAERQPARHRVDSYFLVPVDDRYNRQPRFTLSKELYDQLFAVWAKIGAFKGDTRTRGYLSMGGMLKKLGQKDAGNGAKAALKLARERAEVRKGIERRNAIRTRVMNQFIALKETVEKEGDSIGLNAMMLSLPVGWEELLKNEVMQEEETK